MQRTFNLKSSAKIVKYFDMEQEKRENISEIKRRILQYIDFIAITREGFYKKVSLNGANFRGKSAKSELSGDKIANILRCYPDINPDWLLLGEGEILRKTPQIQQQDASVAIHIEKIADLARENGQLQAENAELKKEIARLGSARIVSAEAAAG